YGDAARAVLVQANGKVNQQGAIADYLDVETGYERAVEACLGELLQHVVVERPEHAAAGFQLVKEANAGRCGFLVTSEALSAERPSPSGRHAVWSTPADVMSAFGRTLPDDIRPLSSVVTVNGPHAEAIRQVIRDAWIAPSYARAAETSHMTPFAVATMEGDVFHGPHLVSGGSQAEARGILETRREIKDLRERLSADRDALMRLSQETADLEAVIAHASNAIAALNAEFHKQEKTIVAHEAQLEHTTEEEARLAQK